MMPIFDKLSTVSRIHYSISDITWANKWLNIPLVLSVMAYRIIRRQSVWNNMKHLNRKLKKVSITKFFKSGWGNLTPIFLILHCYNNTDCVCVDIVNCFLMQIFNFYYRLPGNHWWMTSSKLKWRILPLVMRKQMARNDVTADIE